MSSRLRPVLLLAAVGIAALAVPPLALGAIGATQIGALAGLGAFGICLVAVGLGLRAALAASLVLGALTAVAALAGQHLFTAMVFMTIIAAAFGWTARYGANHATVLIPITLAFVVNEPLQGSADPMHPVALLALSTAVAGCLAGLAAAAALGRTTRSAALTRLSSSRALAFAVLLTITTIATTAIAVAGHWGHAGGWMVMTPFIVMQPYLQDGWRKALRRAAGTVGGFLIAIALATVLGNTGWLLIAGIAFAAATITAYARHADYGIYALLLTPSVVIIEGIGGNVQQTAVERLEATLIGAGLALVAMAIALPLYRRGAREDNLTHY